MSYQPAYGPPPPAYGAPRLLVGKLSANVAGAEELRGAWGRARGADVFVRVELMSNNSILSAAQTPSVHFNKPALYFQHDLGLYVGYEPSGRPTADRLIMELCVGQSFGSAAPSSPYEPKAYDVLASAGVYMAELLDSISKKSPLEVKFDLFNPKEPPGAGTLTPTGTVKLILSYEKREVAAASGFEAPAMAPSRYLGPPPQGLPAPYAADPYYAPTLSRGPRVFPLFLAAMTAGLVVYFADKEKHKKSRR